MYVFKRDKSPVNWIMPLRPFYIHRLVSLNYSPNELVFDFKLNVNWLSLRLTSAFYVSPIHAGKGSLV